MSGSMSTSLELQRLAPTKDWVADSRSRRVVQQPKEEHSDAGDEEEQSGVHAGTLVCDSSYSLPSTNWLKRHFGPPVPLQEEAGASAADSLRDTLGEALPLLREVYAFVCRNRTGHIDWNAVAQSYNAQGHARAPVSAAEAKRLWRAVAYAREDIGDDDPAETPELQVLVREAMGARLEEVRPGGVRSGASSSAAAAHGGASPAAGSCCVSATAPLGTPSATSPHGAAPLGDDDAESDFEGYVFHQREREAAVEQTAADRGKGRATVTTRIVGRPFPPAPGVVPPQPPADGSGPLDLGVEPPRKGKVLTKKEEEEMSLTEAMRLTVTAKPWTDEEDRKLAALVIKHGHKEQVTLERAMKRSWGSIRSRFTILQAKGAIPKLVRVLAFTRYCKYQCCIMYGIQKGGQERVRILRNSRAIVLQ